MKKVYKIAQKDNGKITFYGSDREQKLYWLDGRQYFVHYGQRYYLDDFVAVHSYFHNDNAADYMKEFDGYTNDSAFSGVVVSLCEDADYVKAFTFITGS